jgi:hypothetical protein
VVAVTMFIPNKYVSLTEAVVEAFANQHLDAILAAGLQSHEAKQIATHWLARDRLKEVEFHGREGTRFARSGKKMSGIVPRQLTAKDRAIAQETEELRALAEKGVTLRPLLKTTWNDLRSRLSAGQMIGYLAEPDSGKIHKIAAHEWNRDDADVAFVTGWFSVAHAWGRFAGPVALLRSDFQQTVIRERAMVEPRPDRPNPIGPLLSSARRRGRKGKYDWDEAEIVLMEALNRRGDFDEAGQMDNWNCQACAERLVTEHFGKSDQHPAVSSVRSRVVKVVKQWREDRANNSGD